jgi:hypothetical protein
MNIGLINENASNYASHSWVNRFDKNYAWGAVYYNTDESFNAMLERVKHGFFHYLSRGLMYRYVNEIEFRWNHREPIETTRKDCSLKIVMKSLPVIFIRKSLISHVIGQCLRRSANGGIM